MKHTADFRRLRSRVCPTGNLGKLNSAVGDLRAFAKRADALLAKISELNDRIAALKAEEPARPRIYRSVLTSTQLQSSRNQNNDPQIFDCGKPDRRPRS